MPAAFPKIKAIRYEGADSKNPLSFKHYNPAEIVEGKSMKDHLRFSAVYWHTMRGMGSDMFGVGTACDVRGKTARTRVKMALKRVPVMFEFCQKLGAAVLRLPRPRCRAGRPQDLRESNQEPRRGREGVEKTSRSDTGIKLLWGTAQPFRASALHARRGHQPERGCVRLRRRAGEEGAGSHARSRRRRLHVLGRSRRLLHATQHQHEARAGSSRRSSCTWRWTTKRRSASKASSTSSRSRRSRPSTSMIRTPPRA